MEHMQPPDDADLAKIGNCWEVAHVSDGDGETSAEVVLICGLAEGHEGQLHYDPADHLWWAAVA
jgi:hypothetical protein